MVKNYTDLSDENFDKELTSTDKLVLVDFWNESCIPCKRMAPMLEGLASKYEIKLRLAKVNVDKNLKTVSRFKIMGVPTLLFIKNAKVIARVSGVHTRSELIDIIEKYS